MSEFTVTIITDPLGQLVETQLLFRSYLLALRC